jgi:hypothetical protein
MWLEAIFGFLGCFSNENFKKTLQLTEDYEIVK